jgi:hypothetical protein
MGPGVLGFLVLARGFHFAVGGLVGVAQKRGTCTSLSVVEAEAGGDWVRG